MADGLLREDGSLDLQSPDGRKFYAHVKVRIEEEMKKQVFMSEDELTEFIMCELSEWTANLNGTNSH